MKRHKRVSVRCDFAPVFRAMVEASTRLAGAVILVLLCLPLLGREGNVAHAQLPPPPLPTDPTPLVELITAAERQSLDQSSQPKKRVEAFLDIASDHLEGAHDAIKAGDHRTAERELDIYNKATAESLKVVVALPKGNRGLAKKIEQQLYKDLRTLELIERLFPPERLGFAEAALRHAKQLRVRALNAAFDSGEVLNEADKEEGQKGSPPSGSGAPPRGAMSFRGSLAQRPSSTIPGDYLNEEEDDHVREAQNADDRIKVFMKIAERRLQAIAGPTAAPTDKKAQKKAEEEEREWGPLPKVARAELLKHYARSIEEAVAKLEDAHERNPKSPAIPKALTMLRDATDKHLQALKALEAEVKDQSEIEALRQAVGQAEWANKGARDGLKSK
jgi:hypothetical protein